MKIIIKHECPTRPLRWHFLNYREEVKVISEPKTNGVKWPIFQQWRKRRGIRAEYSLYEWLNALQFVAFTIGYARRGVLNYAGIVRVQCAVSVPRMAGTIACVSRTIWNAIYGGAVAGCAIDKKSAKCELISREPAGWILKTLTEYADKNAPIESDAIINASVFALSQIAFSCFAF